jgi:hypothetical protein
MEITTFNGIFTYKYSWSLGKLTGGCEAEFTKLSLSSSVAGRLLNLAP